MTSSSTVNQDYNLWVLLYQARDAIFKAREKELRQYGLTPVKAATLFVIQAIGDEATPAEIARWLFREPHSITELLNRMAKGGLVRKTRNLGQGNLVRVTITEKGKQAYYQSSESKYIPQILSFLSEEEKQQLRLLLEKLRSKAHQELGVKFKMPYP